jgi:hypothetical protein
MKKHLDALWQKRWHANACQSLSGAELCLKSLEMRASMLLTVTQLERPKRYHELLPMAMDR